MTADRPTAPPPHHPNFPGKQHILPKPTQPRPKPVPPPPIPAADDALRAALERIRRAYERGADRDDLVRLVDAALAQQRSEPAGLDVERLAEVLEWADQKGYVALLGTDMRTDAKGYPIRNDYNGVEREVATALLARLSEPTPDSAAIEAERQRQVADADAGRDPEGAGWTP